MKFFRILIITVTLACFSSGSSSVFAQAEKTLDPAEMQALKNQSMGMYSDFFNNAFYGRLAQWFYLDRAFNKLTRRKTPAHNVNVFDEVPDSTFFVNRIGKKPMSAEEIISATKVNDGPETKGPWVITKGKVDGINPGFFIRDAKGVEFLIKFDPTGYNELSSGAEAVASRIFYGLGFNVPQYSIVYFDPSILTVSDTATYYNQDGFKKSLMMEDVKRLLKNVDKVSGGLIRASASAKLEGDIKGVISFDDYRKNDPNDYFKHLNRREFRALNIFGSWINDVDLRSGNTLSALVENENQGYLNNYFIDYGSSFGSAGSRVKDDHLGYDTFVDYATVAKRILSLGFYDRQWEKRRKDPTPLVIYESIGYFDNINFDPGQWKTILPYYAFDDMSLADAFWAAKIIMKFTPENIRGLIEVGEYTEPKAKEYLYSVLLERQKLIGQYWFSRVTPLDDFSINASDSGAQISFNDLEVFYSLSKDAPKYRYIIKNENQKTSQEFTSSDLEIDLNSTVTDISIEKWNPQKNKWNPPVILTLSQVDGQLKLEKICHKDK